MRFSTCLLVAIALGMTPSPFESSADTAAGAQKGWKQFFDGLKPQPKVEEPPDPLSLDTPADPSPELHRSLARLAEQRGNLEQADSYYRKAIEEVPRDIETIVQYARFKERQGQLDKAIELYKKATNVAPNQALAHNNLGLCLARERVWNEALVALERAIQLDPKNALYRNNISTVLVEVGQLPKAYEHLVVVHGPAIANYNLGYMAQMKGDRTAAIAFFSAALKNDPSLESARQWLAHLATQPDSTSAQHTAMLPREAGPRLSRRRPEGGSSGTRSALGGEAPLPPTNSSSHPARPSVPQAAGVPRFNLTPRPGSIPLPASLPQGRTPLDIQIAPMPPDVYPLPPVR